MSKPQWHAFNDHTGALIAGSNIGIVAQEGCAVLIDAGLDKSAVKPAFRVLDELGAELAAVAITHGHADHFGGAGYAARRAGCPVYAPALEGAFAAHPILEPLFLHGGAAPIAELRSKFTLARESTPPVEPLTEGPCSLAGIDLTVIPLPGHAPAQVGLAYGDTLFCGDAVFPAETLARHPILFCADLDAWLATLARLPRLDHARFVAGHGVPIDDIAPLAEANAARLREIRTLAWESLAEPQEPQAVLRTVAAHYGITFSAPQFLLLSLTTIHAALTSLQSNGEAEIVMKDNRLLWRQT